MMNRSFKMKGIFIVLVIVIFVFMALVLNNTRRVNKKEHAEYERLLLRSVGMYLEAKYTEKIIVENVFFHDDFFTVYAYPENNPQIEIKVNERGSGIMFKDNYLESHSEWEAKTIVDSIVKNYTTNFFCYTSVINSQETINTLLEYYNTNKRHLSWHDENHLDELQFAGIRLYGSDENLVEKNVMEPVLLDILKLNFIIKDVTFYLYENGDEKEARRKYIYEYEDGEYRLRD